MAALSRACEASMWDGIAAVRPGGRLTDISHAVESSIRAAGRYGIVAGYGGHGIGTEMHMAPHILNYGKPGKGPRLTPGHGAGHRADGDARVARRPRSSTTAGPWSPPTAPGPRTGSTPSPCSTDGPWVLTAEDGGRAELEQRGVALSALAA